jgi:hypothetical protein
VRRALAPHRDRAGSGPTYHRQSPGPAVTGGGSASIGHHLPLLNLQPHLDELAGRPLVSHEVIVELIAATRPTLASRVRAEFDRGGYPLGVKVADRVLAAVPLRRHGWRGEWNYTVLPAAA